MAAVSLIPPPPPWAKEEEKEKSARTSVAQTIILKRTTGPLAEGPTLDVCGRHANFFEACLSHILLGVIINRFNNRYDTKFVLKTGPNAGFYAGGNPCGWDRSIAAFLA
jgi:hypothetical protein